MSVWIAVLLAGAGCFALRFGIVALVGGRTLPAWFEPATTFVIPGSLAGLCAVMLIAPITTGGAGPIVAVAAATTATVARRRSSAAALACGMTVIWVAGVAG